MQNKDILESILLEVTHHHQGGRKCLIVFDLDSTLFNVTGRNRRIVREFAKLDYIRKKYPREAELLEQVQFIHTDWGIREALMRQGFTSTPEFYGEIREFWKTHFFSNTYLHEDRPYDGAVEYVRALHGAGGHIAYLTGRDEIRMGPGTRESLKFWKFPDEAEDCLLFLKPDKSIDDAEFKTEIFLKLTTLAPHSANAKTAAPRTGATITQINGSSAIPESAPVYDSIWFFENEPVNIHFLAERLPAIQIVFFDSTHSRKAEPPFHLPTIQSYKRRG